MPAAPDGAIADDELAGLFAGLEGASGLLLAVSGGADSLALLDLVDRWRRRHDAPPPIVVATVDHGLRPQSASEARSVAAIAAKRGLHHFTLMWSGTKPATGVEEAAREARYALLADAARSSRASHVLTAHHRGDQAETVLMRLGRGSGLAGLAGMRAERPLGEGITLARPLLGMPKQRLVATVEAAGLVPAIDDSNFDRRFARARLRAALPVLAAEGIDSDGIARTAATLRRANDALEHYARLLIAEAVAVNTWGVVTVARDAIIAAPDEIGLRVLSQIVNAVGGGAWPPRSEQVEGVLASVVGRAAFKRTIAGAIVRGGGAAIEIYRESGRTQLPEHEIASGFSGVWDHRFAVSVAAAPAGRLTLGPLREEGRREIGATGLRHASPMLAGLPAFRLDGRVVAVPLLDEAGPYHPALVASIACVLPEKLGLRSAPRGDAN